MDFSGCGDDDSFGPAVRGCRGDFDFTIRFEQLILGIIPPAVFVALVLPRLLSLWQRPVLVAGHALLAAKVASVLVLGGLQLGLLILASQPGQFKALFTASSALALLSSVSMLALSWLEHVRSPRPSILLSGYLSLSLLFDITMSRTFWLARTTTAAALTGGDGARLASSETLFCRLFSAALAVKFVLLALEATHKTRLMRPDAGWEKEDHSPEETSGLFGLGAFAWLTTIFWRGYHKVLVIEDLFALDPAMSAQRLEARLAKYVVPKEDDGSRSRSTYYFGGKSGGLAKALVKTLSVELLLPVGPRLALTGFLFGQPFLINSALAFLDTVSDVGSADTQLKNRGYGLIAATFLIYCGIAASTAVYFYFQQRAMFMIRGALAAAVYRKTTEQSLATQASEDNNNNNNNNGKASASLTLMSTDVERIRVGLLIIHEYWANAIQIALASWLLQRTLGTPAAFVAPLVVILVAVGVMGSMVALTGRRQKAWMSVIQKRVGMTSNAIAHMKHLRISGMAAPIEALIQALRVEELHVGSRFRVILCFAITAAYAPQMLSPVFAFVFSIGLDASDQGTDSASIFTALSFVVLVTMPFIEVLQGLPGALAAFACLDRVQAFLEKDPRDDFREGMADEKSGRSDTNDTNGRNDSPPATAMAVRAARLGWGADKFHLPGIQLEIPAGKLTMVVGPVASGKSTLCKALLGEVPFYESEGSGAVLRVSNLRTEDGRLRRIGYCDQDPFLFNASVRDNIVGVVSADNGYDEQGQEASFDEARYKEALEAAMLLPDLALLPQGDRSKVGSNGITLSGGQKQRVSIARALYAVIDSATYIFDDVLSGLDTDTEQHVFQRVFGPAGLLTHHRRATIILCTHSVRHLPAADHVVALDVSGRIVEQGTFQTLLANRKYVHNLGVKARDDADTEGSSSGSNADVAVEVHQQDTCLATIASQRLDEQLAGTDDTTSDQLASRALGDTTVYRHYFSRIGAVPLTAFAVFGLSFGFLYNWGTIWIKFWVQDHTPSTDGAAFHPKHSDGFYLALYGAFQTTGLVCLFLVSLTSFRTMIMVSGARLHREALQTVVRAPLRFFTTTDNGSVTNLFSQDMTLIDGELPSSLTNFGVGWFLTLCSAAVIAASSPYLAIAYPVLGAAFWVLQRFYLRTSRQLRLLDLEAKSPLYTHFLDTMAGLATFRAYGWAAAGAPQTRSPAVVVNDRLVDRSQRPAYLLAMVQQWLTFSLHMLVAVMATALVALATQLQVHSSSSSSSGKTAFTGASLVLLMNFGDVLSFIMYSYTQLETSIGAVSRLKTFSETVRGESDGDTGPQVMPPSTWPSGHVRLQNVSATYVPLHEVARMPASNKGPPFVLNSLSLTIRAGEKVAICGRTGSGKSSFLLLLLRLLDPWAAPAGAEASSVYIDDLPLHTIDRPTLRERVIAVPQDAVFLPDGTSFRQNLDPFRRDQDQRIAEHRGDESGPAHAAMCQAVLEAVELWPFVQERGGLDAGMTADTLSQGQKQLFSLARAIVRKRKRQAGGVVGGLLLLDEVSSFVDQDTDRAMQTVIRDEFAGYTVIMVSHRLDMVLATCDTVVVLDQGRVAETGRPAELVETDGSRFRELWNVGKSQ